jgi:undecaprenyl-diphosphatase
VRWLLKFIATHDFRGFAWYRIVFGIIVLVTAYTHLIAWQA